MATKTVCIRSIDPNKPTSKKVVRMQLDQDDCLQIDQLQRLFVSAAIGLEYEANEIVYGVPMEVSVYVPFKDGKLQFSGHLDHIYDVVYRSPTDQPGAFAAPNTESTGDLRAGLKRKLERDRANDAVCQQRGGNYPLSESFLQKVLVAEWHLTFDGLMMGAMSGIMTTILDHLENRTNISCGIFDLEKKNDTNNFQALLLRVVVGDYNFEKLTSEAACAARYNNMIYLLLGDLDELIYNNAIKLVVDRNKSLSVTSHPSQLPTERRAGRKLLDKALKRPDFSMKDFWGRILFKGVEKLSIDDLEKARDQLQGYCFGHHKQHYAGIRYTFGYAAASSTLELYAFDHEQEQQVAAAAAAASVPEVTSPRRIFLSKFELSIVQDRVRLAVNMFALHRICDQMSRANPPEAILVKTITNPTTQARVVFYANGYVCKTVRVEYVGASRSRNGLRDLEEFYKLIRTGKIVCTVECVDADRCTDGKTDIWAVLTKPVGKRDVLDQVRGDLHELRHMLECLLMALQSMHKENFVHNDVKWSNVVSYHPPGLHRTYLLIDFESVLKVCKMNAKNDCSRQEKQIVRNHKHGHVRDDTRCVFDLFDPQYFSSQCDDVNNFVVSFTNLEGDNANITEMLQFVKNYQ